MSFTVKTSKDSFKIDYSMEKFEDEVLETIKNFCLSYLDNKKCIIDITDDELFAMFTFLRVKMDDVNRLRKSLDIKKYSYPFVDNAKLIDEITLSDSILSTSERSIMFLITKEINYLIDILNMCFKIIKKLNKDRKLI